MTNTRRTDSTPTIRVGIDFGNTIGRLEDSEPATGACEMIRHLIHKLGSDNVFIISKAGKKVEQQIRDWLKHTDFYQQTGFAMENLIFVREYVDKASVVESLGISIFFDDHVKVIRVLAPLSSTQRIFWMHADEQTDIQHIPKRFRSKIAIVDSWGSTMKFFQKLASVEKHEET